MHPASFAQSAFWHDEGALPAHEDITIASASGCWLTETSGHRLFDAGSGHSCVNLGYAHPELIATAAESYQRLAYCSPEHRTASVVTLADALSARLGGGYRMRFATTGGAANELAIEIAHRYWRHRGRPGKRQILAFDRAYHGSTGAASFASAPGILQSPLAERSAEFRHSPGARDVLHGADRSLEEIRAGVLAEIAAAGAESIAALIVEPLAFAGGVVIPPEGTLAMLADLARAHDILLIVDEVIAGFGRSGRWFAFQHEEGFRPDLITMAKGITSAYFPLAATAVAEPIYETFLAPGQAMQKVITMAGHPVGCDIALAVQRIMERDGLVAAVARHGSGVLAGLRALEGVGGIRQVRGLGHMWGLEFGGSSPEAAAAQADSVARLCYEEGVLVLHAAHQIRLNPPLVATEAELAMLVATLTRAVHRAATLASAGHIR